MLRILSLLLVLFVGVNAYADAPSERQKMDYLINTLERSHVTFIRNGIPMNSKDAAEHLRDKLGTWKEPIPTVEDFITKIGSLSSHSGKPYIIKLKDGTEEPASQWFQEKLAARESNDKQPE